MLSKLIFGAALATGAAVQGHSIHAREAVNGHPFVKVNRDGGGGGHSHGSSSSSSGSSYGSPQAATTSYNAPSPSYSAPAPSYSAPAPSYSAPAPSYNAPEPSYSAPSYSPEPSYGTPSTGYGEESGGLDLTSILIPLLALVGLSLLFPTYVSLTTVRKKRSVDGSGEEGEFPGQPL